MRRRLALLSIVVLIALVGGSGYYTLPRASGEQTSAVPGGISLVRPAIAQQTEASFLDTDAGMSVYSNTGFAINISQAKSAFRVVEQETSSWIVGTVQAHGYNENEDPHVFVHESGWIIAYYDKESDVARTVHFVAPGTLGITKLEDALQKVSNSAGAPVINLGFYNFSFPNATEWLLIVDRDTFSVEIPTQFAVFERSFLTKGETPNGLTSVSIDGVTISAINNSIQYGAISPSLLSTGSEHQVVRFNSAGSYAISLIYTPPAVQ